MKQIFLCGKNGSVIGNYALVDDADYEWLNQYRWTAMKTKSGIYACKKERDASGKRVIMFMHRMVLGLTKKNEFCDHAFGNTLDNQSKNIRKCTAQENQRNKKSSVGSSKYKGVQLPKGGKKWVAAITFDGKPKHLGTFDIEADAALAYNEAAIKHFGKFARLNDLSIQLESNTAPTGDKSDEG